MALNLQVYREFMETEVSDRIGACAWAGSLAAGVVLMLRPLPEAAQVALAAFSRADLVFHFSFFVYLTLIPHMTRWGRAWRGWIAAGLVGFGVLLEVAQGFTPSRSPFWGDAVANALGVYAGTKICLLLGDGGPKNDSQGTK